jgi:hypothetical protein
MVFASSISVLRAVLEIGILLFSAEEMIFVWMHVDQKTETEEESSHQNVSISNREIPRKLTRSGEET